MKQLCSRLLHNSTHHNVRSADKFRFFKNLIASLHP